MGLALLGLRLGVMESGMFASLRTQQVSRGNFLLLFANRRAGAALPERDPGGRARSGTWSAC